MYILPDMEQTFQLKEVYTFEKAVQPLNAPTN